MSDLFGFDEEYYLNAKLKSLEGDPEHADITTTEELKEVMAQSGMSPQEHYKRYGNSENVNTSAYFNKAEYLTAKLVALRESPETSEEWANKSIDELEAVMAQSGMTPAEHYTRYGYAETRADGTLLNPSNAFDANAYFAAKLAELQKTNPEHYANATVLDVVGIFQEQQLDPVSHYLNYGASEAVISKTPMVQTVPTSQRMPEDPARAEMGTLVPDNPSKPSLPPSQALPFEVPQPGDMGGHNYETVLPPAKEPVPTPEIPGITPKPEEPKPEEPKPEEPKPEEPKPEEPGGDSGGTGGDSGDSGGDSGDSGGDSGGGGGGGGTGGDSGGTGGDSGGTGGGGGTDPDPTPEPEPEPEPLPEGEPIVLTKANATVTPLGGNTAAGGRATGNNRSDFVKIADAAALNAVMDAGTCNDGRENQENDTLTISVATNGNPLANDGIVNLSMTNFETLVLGEGVQKVRPGDYFKHDNNTLKHVVFDDAEDVLDLSGIGFWYSHPGLNSITTKGAGQGNIVFHDYKNEGETYIHDDASFYLTNVDWGEGNTINSILFNNTDDKYFYTTTADLEHVGIVDCGANGYYSYLNLSGKIEADENGKGQIFDSHVKNFRQLGLDEATFADDVTSLEVDAQFTYVRMHASQWAHMKKLSTSDTGNELDLWGDWANPSVNKIAVNAILDADAVTGFSSLAINGVQDLDKLDVSKSAFTKISLDSTTANTLTAKAVVGNSNQTLCANNVYDEMAFTALSNIQGFTALELNGFWFEGTRTLTLKQGSTLETINLYNWNTPSVTSGRLHIQDTTDRTNTVHAQTGIALKTTGIENIEISSSAVLDVSCFDDKELTSVTGGGNLYLNGTVTQELMDSFASSDGIVSYKSALSLSVATLDAGLTTIDAAKFGCVEFANTQAPTLNITNLSALIIHGNNITAGDLDGLTLTGKGGATPTITINGDYSGVNIDMTGYAANLNINGDRGTLIGGEGADTFWSYGYGTQKGGAGNDALRIHVYPNEVGTVALDGGTGDDTLSVDVYSYYNFRSDFKTYTMTGGTGLDHFTAEWDMDQLETAGENASTYPDIRLEITDFTPVKTSSDPDSGVETLNISNIRYDGLPGTDGQATTQYFESGDYIAAVADTKSATAFNVALQNAAKTITADKIGVFEFGGDTYLFGNNMHVAVDRGDLLIKLTGVDADQLTADNFVFHF